VDLALELDNRGNIATDDAHRTSVPGVFSAGDARRGASLIVWAIREGRDAADSIDAWLRELASSEHQSRPATTSLPRTQCLAEPW
jgi:NADPH-dependent glutamate synthase beta subunit-like oxidoreductase